MLFITMIQSGLGAIIETKLNNGNDSVVVKPSIIIAPRDVERASPSII